MAFYIIEKKEQLENLFNINSCFVRVINYNNNYHPFIVKDKISLIYIRPLNDHKGYIICIKHSESLSLNLEYVKNFLSSIKNAFVIDKKEMLYYNLLSNNIYDVKFFNVKYNIDELLGNNCINYYYNNMGELDNLNCLIPISKHYEECEKLFNGIQNDIFNKLTKRELTGAFEECYKSEYSFNNSILTYAFYNIEKEGLKINKEKYLLNFKDRVHNHQYNIYKGKIYTQYNLYTKTGRPSNTFNNINFGALNKKTGERSIIIPSNNELIEMDINGYHPRILAELIKYKFPENQNIYEHLSEVLNEDNVKELVFTQMYGGVEEQYKNKPYFKDIVKYVENLPKPGFISSNIRNINNIYDNQYKTLSYIIQGLETYKNSCIIYEIQKFLENKRTKLILYTYDSFLLDYSIEDGETCIEYIKNIIKYPVKIKRGLNYNEML